MSNYPGHPHSENVESFLRVVIIAVDEACKEILKVYQSEDFQTERKEDRSPVTLADRRAHDVIVRRLKETGLPVLSEEGKSISYEERRGWKYFWLVDPLDGTKEFLKRNGEFTVNIALINGNEPAMGVIGIPVTGDLYYAVRGTGAFHRSNGSTVQLARRQPTDLNQPGLRVVASRSHMNEETTDFINRLKEPQLISRGSSLKFIAVAKGEADVYPRYIPSMEWDSAAADVIVREVGLSVRDVEHQRPLLYNKENLLNPYFICS